MIDIHCHILPGLDDGPVSLDESLEMCRIAYEDGIRTIVATPHYHPGVHAFTAAHINAKKEELQYAIRKENMQIALLLGADIAITPELDRCLDRYPYLTINGSGKYFLVEFPHAASLPKWDAFLDAFIRKGMVPIITHPERNGWFLSHADALIPFVRDGGLVQITAMSLIGESGEAVRKYCCTLLERRCAHIIATDGHSSTGRIPVLSRAVDAASKVIGRDAAVRMVTDVPQAVINGERIELDEPLILRPRKSRWFQRLTRV